MGQRLEREIEEILAREAPDFSGPPRPVPFRRRRRFRLPHFLRVPAKLPNTSLLMLVSIVLAVLVLFVNPVSSIAGTILAVVSLMLFVTGYVKGFRGPQAVSSEKRWRGQAVNYGRADEPAWVRKIRHWMRDR